MKANLKNNQGFTMIELLAVITIMAILFAIAVPSVARYLTKARTTSIDTMLKSSYDAAENYLMDNNINLAKCGTTTIKIKTLVDQQYLEPLIDPVSKSNKCYTDAGPADQSEIVVKRINDENAIIPSYVYKVTIKCPESGTKIDYFTEGTDKDSSGNQITPQTAFNSCS